MPQKEDVAARQIVEIRLQELIAGGLFAEAATLALRSYGPEILGYLNNVMDDFQGAKEVYSQFIEDLWRGIPRFRPLAMFRTWAYCVARHALARYYRDAFRRRACRLTEEQARLLRETSEGYLAARMGLEETVSRIRQQLSLLEREILTLHFEHGMEWQEVATVVGLSHAAVRKRFQRIKEKIRAQLESEESLAEGRP